MLILACLAASLAGATPADSTPPRPITQWIHTTWTTREGAPINIRSMAQTPDGYLWLGTVSGLVRFDGVRFVTVSDTTIAHGAKRLLASSDGSLWVVWAGGDVTRMGAGHAEHFGPETGLPSINELTESKTGVLIAGTVNGIYRFTGGKWTNVSRDWGYQGQQAAEVWFDRDAGLWTIEGRRVSYRPAAGPSFLDAGELRTGSGPTDFAEASDGTIWLAELGRSVHTMARPGEHPPFSEVQVGSNITLVDRKGSLWIGTAGDGLRRVPDPARIRGRSIGQFGPEAEQFTESNGLLTDVIDVMLEDREGNIWVASTRGLERFREGAFLPNPIPNGVRGRIVYAARDTSLWVATFNRLGFYRTGPGNPSTVSTTWFPVNWAEDSSGNIWSVDRYRIARLDGKAFAILPSPRPRPEQLQDIAVDPSGNVWLYDGKMGLVRLAHDSLIQVSPPDVPTVPLGKLFVDRVGRIWVAEYHQVLLDDHGRLRRFAKDNGFQDWVQTFHEDRDGTIWTVGPRGISRFENGRLRTMPARQALPGLGVFAMAVDDEGAWWVLNRTSVLRLPPGEVQRAWADSNYQMQYRSFDQLDGIPGTFPQTMLGPWMTRTADGRIWVASDSGVASVDPRHLPAQAAPPVLIEALRVDGRERPAGGDQVLPPRPANLEIDYTAMTLSIPERARFRYRLDGEDAGWQEVGTRRKAYYTGLGPGVHTFRVSDANGNGLWNPDEAVLVFRILPAWYQTLWFKALLVLAIGGLGGAAVALIQRSRHHRAQEALAAKYEATLAERSRIAQDLHDTLLQGFAGVSMQLKTAERALPDQPDVAAETLVQVQQLTRETLREARQRVLDLHEPDLGDEDVASALDTNGRSLIGNAGIGFFLTANGERRRLPREVEMAAIRIGREAIANAVKHAEARRIEVIVGFEPGALHLQVRDDGRGFTPEQGERARGEGHLGLTGMQDRAARAGGSCEVRPGPTGGTEVAVELPLKAADSNL